MSISLNIHIAGRLCVKFIQIQNAILYTLFKREAAKT